MKILNRKCLIIGLLILMVAGVYGLWGQGYTTVIAISASDGEEPPEETADQVTLQVSVPTNCRSGPGKAYNILTVLHTGQTVKVVARHETQDFWVIEHPDGCAWTCWVWGYYATITGPKDSLPIEDAPPKPTDVTLKVSVPTNCRMGPGKGYEIATVLHTGKTVTVLARHESGKFWLAEHPDGCDTPCWVWDYYATLTGPAACLPVEGPPPAPTEVTLEVTVPTNCRVGPGKGYDIVSVLHTGRTANVVGRDKSGYYWVIENPEGDGTCLVWGYYAKLSGPATCLPIGEIPTD